MKTFAAICAFCLSILGCASNRSSQDSFISLHGLVERTLAGDADCGSIITNQDGGRYFEVRPLPQGLLVTVSEQQFFSQKEWDRHYTSGTNRFAQYIQFLHKAKTNGPPDAKALARFAGLTNMFGLFELPAWHYQNIGVDVGIQQIDETYPGVDLDDAEAQKRYAEIVKFLKPYLQADVPPR
ncbi:MAG TPA: hypothetical protein VKV04_20225 [Verrucomicrobiae bacterium]|nr:hypothetical protein [Verrucomicrobiae bacterium]